MHVERDRLTDKVDGERGRERSQSSTWRYHDVTEHISYLDVTTVGGGQLSSSLPHRTAFNDGR